MAPRRLNTSEATRDRIIQLIAQLIADANRDRTIGHWQHSNAKQLQLIIQCSTEEFLQQCYGERLPDLTSADPTRLKKAKSTASTWWHNDRQILLQKLQILQDRRLDHPQGANGSRTVNFIFTLWSQADQGNDRFLSALWSKTFSPQATPAFIPNNLPRGRYQQLVGYSQQRQKLAKLLTCLDPPALITIDGPGGSGKTSLVVNVVQEQLNELLFPFSIIVFTSAQGQICTPHGIQPRPLVDRTLKDILHNILTTLNTYDVGVLPTDILELQTKTIAALAHQSTLLIIDNIETTDSKDLGQLYTFIHALPSTVTTIITSRTRLAWGQVISLKGLTAVDSLALIQQVATQKTLSIPLAQAKQLHDYTGGLPLAIDYLLMRAYQQGNIQPLAQPPTSQDDLMKFCFAELMETFRGTFTHRLLLAFALFRHPTTAPAAYYVAGIEQRILESYTALEHLRHFNLISLNESNDCDTYAIHALTRAYGYQELLQDAPYADQYRDRWVTYYRHYTHPYSQLNWRDWQDYSGLDQEWLNLRDVVEDCLERGELDNFAALWQSIQGYTLIHGKWAERLDWLDRWAILSPDQPHHLAPALYYHSQTLAHCNETASSSILPAQQAWEIAQKLDLDASDSLHFDIALHLAAIHIRQSSNTTGKLTIARQWLQKAQALLASPGDDHKRLSQQAQMMYYQAEIYFCASQHTKAQQLYRKTQQLAAEVDFRRLITYANSRIAINAHKLGKLQDAYDRFQTVLTQSQQHQDYRAIAMTQFNLAQVQQDRCHRCDAKAWAEQAQQSFQRLLMEQEVTKVQTFLKNLLA
jgi:NB-ARC domain